MRSKFSSLPKSLRLKSGSKSKEVRPLPLPDEILSRRRPHRPAAASARADKMPYFATVDLSHQFGEPCTIEYTVSEDGTLLLALSDLALAAEADDHVCTALQRTAFCMPSHLR